VLMFTRACKCVWSTVFAETKVLWADVSVEHESSTALHLSSSQIEEELCRIAASL